MSMAVARWYHLTISTSLLIDTVIRLTTFRGLLTQWGSLSSSTYFSLLRNFVVPSDLQQILDMVSKSLMVIFLFVFSSLCMMRWIFLNFFMVYTPRPRSLGASSRNFDTSDTFPGVVILLFIIQSLTINIKQVAFQGAVFCP
ncbi:hypothetical protein B0H34DRAFT_700093 [Crassisporium funariophilum]|nr:hypothetical protein B0H34DRAFT_700093 [Crassisporium funariophilum]